MTGPGPFVSEAEVQDRAGAVLAQTQANVWQERTSSPSSVGEDYDYVGLIDSDAADALVGQRNRVLVVEGRRYNVVDAVAHRDLPHVEVSLRVVDPDG